MQKLPPVKVNENIQQVQLTSIKVSFIEKFIAQLVNSNRKFEVYFPKSLSAKKSGVKVHPIDEILPSRGGRFDNHPFN